MNRKLTHTLVYDDETEHWVCSRCPYILGQGHEKLYARCKGSNPKTNSSEGPKRKPKTKWHKHATPNSKATGAGRAIQATQDLLLEL